MAQRPLAAQAGVVKGGALLLLLHILQGTAAQQRECLCIAELAAVDEQRQRRSQLRASTASVALLQGLIASGQAACTAGVAADGHARARTLGWMSTARRELMQ